MIPETHAELNARFWSLVDVSGIHVIRIPTARMVKDMLDSNLCSGSTDFLTPSPETAFIDINARNGTSNKTLLIHAICMGSVEVVKMLLDCGADPNIPWQGHTPLVVAISVSKGNAVSSKIVKMLIHAGSDLEVKCDGKTAMHYCIQEKCNEYGPSILKMLLLHGANTETRYDTVRRNTFLSRTVFHVAVWCGNVWAFEILLDAGADLNAHDNMNMSVLELLEDLWDNVGQKSHREMLDRVAMFNETPNFRKDMCTVVAMGNHQTFGEKSLLNILDKESLRRIIECYQAIDVFQTG